MKGLLESLSASLEFAHGGEHIVPSLSDGPGPDPVDLCIECGAPVLSHFDRRNRWCGHQSSAPNRVQQPAPPAAHDQIDALALTAGSKVSDPVIDIHASRVGR